MSRYRKKKKTAAIVVAIVAGVLLLGTLSTLGAGLLKKERNPENLIRLDEIVLETVNDEENGIEITVDDLGAVKLKGEAKADVQYTYARVDLPTGTYDLTGCKNGKANTYHLALVVDGTPIRSDDDPIAITEAGIYDVVIIVKEGHDFGLFADKITPVISGASSDVSFYK